MCQTVVELPHAGNKKVKFYVRPELAIWERSLFGKKRDFDFENHPVFSKRYQLSGNNEAAVRALFTTSVIEFFEQREQLWVECIPNRFLFCREGVSVEPAGIRDLIAEAVRCYRLLEGSAK